MPAILWPRQEVLQLVIPHLGLLDDNHLRNSTVARTIKHLRTLKTTDGKISFENWRQSARDHLRWNDNCVLLFWDMLSLATYYLGRDPATYGHSECGIDLEYVSIFLIMHIHDKAEERPASPRKVAGYEDTMWPTTSSDEQDDVDGTASASTAERRNPHSPTHKNTAGIPVSPRSAGHASPRIASPRNKLDGSPSGSAAAALAAGTHHSPRNGPSSPSHGAHLHAHSRVARTTAQYLLAVRNKLPFILHALCAEEMEQFEGSRSLAVKSFSTDDFDPEADFLVPKAVLDSLGLILCGGKNNREQHESMISSLHPSWAPDMELLSASAKKASRDNNADQRDTDHDTVSAVPFSELQSWIDTHLSMNDILYPSSILPNYESASSPKHSGIRSLDVDSPDKMNTTEKNSKPSRVCTPMASLTRFAPVVINHSISTVIHVTALHASKSATIRRMKTLSRDLDEDQINALAEGSFSPSQGPQHLDIENVSLSQQVLSPRHMAAFNSGAPVQGGGTTASPMQGSVTPPQSPLRQPPYSPFSEPQSGGAGSGGSDSSGFLPVPAPSSGGGVSAVGSNAARHARGISRENSQFSVIASQGSHSRDNSSGSNGMGGSGNLMRPELRLPQAFINSCDKASIYLACPYYSVSINACIDCDITIGAVYGAVIVNGCEKIRLTTACKKLIVLNCLDCEFNVATAGASIIAGDCRSLTFGPFNTAYKNLRHHLRVTDLDELVEGPKAGLAATSLDAQGQQQPGESSASLTPAGDHTSSSSSSSSSSGLSHNCWSLLCDANACMYGDDKSGIRGNNTSSSTAAAGELAAHSLVLPAPQPSVACLKTADKYRFNHIPYKSECVSFELCPFAIPLEYINSLKAQHSAVANIKQHVCALTEESLSDQLDQDEEVTPKSISSTTLSAAFLSWLVNSEKAQKVIDLIKIDDMSRQAALHGRTHSQELGHSRAHSQEMQANARHSNASSQSPDESRSRSGSGSDTGAM